MSKQSLEDLRQQATASFPYQLDPTGITQGELEVEPDEDVEYAEEYTFEVGQLVDEQLLAGGWIELRRDEGEVTITGFFGVARNGDWENGRILPDDTAIQCTYNTDTAEWELWIDKY